MSIPGLRTLSSRIIVGFAVLILTFGGVSLVTLHNMGALSREIRVIRTGYLRLALVSKDLSEKQNSLRDYLSKELTGEVSAKRVASRVMRFRKARGKLLDHADATLNELSDLPKFHRRRMDQTAEKLRAFRARAETLAPLYDDLVAAPPIERRLNEPGAPAPQAREKATQALHQLRKEEGKLYSEVFAFERRQRIFVERTAIALEHKEGLLRRYTLYLGMTAVLVGLLITIWATLTLRPLRRLRDAAKRIARGDYASRIEEMGPSEVADLAREFNVMGTAIEERERELVRSERLVAVGKMAAMITHEVRNPLSSIGLNTELLEEELTGLPPESQEEALALCRAINREVDRLTGITEEYLRFARLPKPKLREADVSRLVDDLTDFEKEQLATRGVNLEVQLGETPATLVDEDQLRQAFLNLLRNAAEAVEKIGGTVTVCTFADSAANSVCIRVSDDGPGIEADLIGNLFEPFFSTKEGGTGLGLALTHQIIREHGGTIQVDAAPGRGATFTVSLPRSATTVPGMPAVEYSGA